mmetsp:Transcript_78/g.103  ORF Transcript_78/g.103 Transcript_78/m.103 type:complete len:108 (+) Transcript_78:1-324(+)
MAVAGYQHPAFIAVIFGIWYLGLHVFLGLVLCLIFLDVAVRFLYFKSPKPVEPKEGEVAVVTGASRGIGREIALKLAKLGYHVVLIARSNDAISELADHIQVLLIRM